MKPTTYEQREKQPATRGDVLKNQGAQPNSENRPPRVVRVTVRLSVPEGVAIQERADAAGLNLSEYIRREVTGAGGVSRETALVLAEVGRTRELVTRCFDCLSDVPVDSRWVGDVVRSVEAIDDKVFVARATKGKA